MGKILKESGEEIVLDRKRAERDEAKQVVFVKAIVSIFGELELEEIRESLSRRLS